MDINKTEDSPDFVPYTLEIKIESKEEEDFFEWLRYANSSVPEAIQNTVMPSGKFVLESLQRVYRKKVVPLLDTVL